MSPCKFFALLPLLFARPAGLGAAEVGSGTLGQTLSQTPILPPATLSTSFLKTTLMTLGAVVTKINSAPKIAVTKLTAIPPETLVKYTAAFASAVCVGVVCYKYYLKV